MITEQYFLINESRSVFTKIDYIKLMGIDWCKKFIKKYDERTTTDNHSTPAQINRSVGIILLDILLDWLSGDNQDVTKDITSNIELLRKLKKVYPDIFRLDPKHKIAYRGTNISDSKLRKFIAKTLNSKDWVDASIGHDDYKVFTGRKFEYKPKSELQSFSVDAKISSRFGDGIIVTKTNDKDFYFNPTGIDKINPSYKEKETIHHGKHMMVYLAIDKDEYDEIVLQLSRRGKNTPISQVKFK